MQPWGSEAHMATITSLSLVMWWTASSALTSLLR